MGYANIAIVELHLGQALTSASPVTSDRKLNLNDIGAVRDLNRIPDDTVEYYIQIADSQIDGILTEMYKAPLKKCAHGQWDLDTAIDEYNQNVETMDTTNLVRGDEIVIRDDDTGVEEFHVVSEVVDQFTFITLEPILTNFTGDNVRVIRITFPPPIPQVSGRFAAAFIYDKYFSAQVSPDLSNYGDKMRSVAIGQLNDILNGKIILGCQRRIGDRFGNAYLSDLYSLQDRGFNTSERNMDQQGK